MLISNASEGLTTSTVQVLDKSSKYFLTYKFLLHDLLVASLFIHLFVQSLIPSKCRGLSFAHPSRQRRHGHRCSKKNVEVRFGEASAGGRDGRSRGQDHQLHRAKPEKDRRVRHQQPWASTTSQTRPSLPFAQNTQPNARADVQPDIQPDGQPHAQSDRVSD